MHIGQRVVAVVEQRYLDGSTLPAGSMGTLTEFDTGECAITIRWDAGFDGLVLEEGQVEPVSSPAP